MTGHARVIHSGMGKSRRLLRLRGPRLRPLAYVLPVPLGLVLSGTLVWHASQAAFV